MPKATLEFNLPEETEEFQTAINAGKVLSRLDDWEQEMRKIIKYDVLPEPIKKICAENKVDEGVALDIIEEMRTIYFHIISED